MKDEKSAAVINGQDPAGDERKRWEQETHDPSLKKIPERNIPFTTVSGLPINNLYSPVDVQDIDFNKKLAGRANIHTPVVFIQQCINRRCGRCGNSLVLARPHKPMRDCATLWPAEQLV